MIHFNRIDVYGAQLVFNNVFIILIFSDLKLVGIKFLFALQIEVQLELSQQEKQTWEETKMYKWQDFQDFSLRRMFKKYILLGVAALPKDKFKQLMLSISGMESNYATAKICAYKNATKCDLSLEPGKNLCDYLIIIINN